MPSSLEPKRNRNRLVTTLIETFGFSPLWASIVALFLTVLAAATVVWLWLSAPPRTIRILSGPPGSSFERYALDYKKELAKKHGLAVEIIPTGGSADNLRMLVAGEKQADVAFVQGGLLGVDQPAPPEIVSLGSVANQPIWLFYRGDKKIVRLSDLVGLRIGVGPEGSGTNVLATTLLQWNSLTGPGIPPQAQSTRGGGSTPPAPIGSVTIVEEPAETAAAALLAGKLDAIFLMGEAASTTTLRSLNRAENVQMVSFTQADAYVRRIHYLNRITLPQGSLDLGRNVPAQDVVLVGPAIELLARKEMHSALVDVLLDAAQKVHGRPGLLARRGEFPAPIEREYTISSDARRFYKEGLSMFYESVGLHAGSLIKRALVVIVPLILLLIPIMRILPLAYRWSVQLRIFKYYRPLLRLERETQMPLSRAQADEMLARLDDIERGVHRLKVPASFAFQFYALREHVAFVRERLETAVEA